MHIRQGNCSYIQGKFGSPSGLQPSSAMRLPCLVGGRALTPEALDSRPRHWVYQCDDDPRVKQQLGWAPSYGNKILTIYG